MGTGLTRCSMFAIGTSESSCWWNATSVIEALPWPPPCGTAAIFTISQPTYLYINQILISERAWVLIGTAAPCYPPHCTRSLASRVIGRMFSGGGGLNSSKSGGLSPKGGSKSGTLGGSGAAGSSKGVSVPQPAPLQQGGSSPVRQESMQSQELEQGGADRSYRSGQGTLRILTGEDFEYEPGAASPSGGNRLS